MANIKYIFIAIFCATFGLSVFAGNGTNDSFSQAKKYLRKIYKEVQRTSKKQQKTRDLDEKG
jgi:hypothetical protein